MLDSAFGQMVIDWPIFQGDYRVNMVVRDKLLLMSIYEVAFVPVVVPMRGTPNSVCQQKFVADHQDHPVHFITL